MKQEISSPLLQNVINKLEEIHAQTKKRKISILEATARITAIKHMIQATALDWLYNRKPVLVDKLNKRSKKLLNES